MSDHNDDDFGFDDGDLDPNEYSYSYSDDEEMTEKEKPVSFWHKFAMKNLPFLFRVCKFGAKHWKWHRLCTCGFGEIDDDNDWHGGVYDMDLDNELQPCAICFPDHSGHSHQWGLTHEEEALIECWREYRQQVLNHFSSRSPYKYTIQVELNGLKTFLMSREQQGVLGGDIGLLGDTKRLTKKGTERPN